MNPVQTVQNDSTTGHPTLQESTDGAAHVALQAGSAIVGKVGIDQTTPGATNAVQDISVRPGESAAYDRQLVQQSFPIQQISTIATTTLVTGPGVLGGFIIVATTVGVFKVYDNTAGSGMVLFDSTGITLTVGQTFSLPQPIEFSIGLTIVTTGTAITLNTLLRPQ